MRDARVETPHCFLHVVNEGREAAVTMIGLHKLRRAFIHRKPHRTRKRHEGLPSHLAHVTLASFSRSHLSSSLPLLWLWKAPAQRNHFFSTKACGAAPRGPRPPPARDRLAMDPLKAERSSSFSLYIITIWRPSYPAKHGPGSASCAGVLYQRVLSGASRLFRPVASRSLAART